MQVGWSILLIVHGILAVFLVGAIELSPFFGDDLIGQTAAVVG